MTRTEHRPLPELTDADLDRLVTSLHRDLDDPAACWVQAKARGGTWTTPARFVVDGVLYLTSRLVYAATYGVDPGPLTVEHVCGEGKRGCVNPGHLVLLTRADNARAATSGCAGAVNARKTVCIRGHDLDEAHHTTDTKGRPKRVCRACERARYIERTAR